MRNYNVYRQTGIQRDKKRGLLKPLPILVRIWLEISIDFITGLPLTCSNQSTNIIVVIDCLSKTIILELIREITIESIVKILLMSLIRHYKILQAIILDYSLQFTSQMQKRLYYLLNIKRRLLIVYYLEINGAIKCAN